MKVYRITASDDEDQGVVYQSDEIWHIAYAIGDLLKFSQWSEFHVDSIEVNDERFGQSGYSTEKTPFN